MKEPVRLKQGKVFHKKIQDDWHRDAEGEVTSERGVRKPSGRVGRVDILVDPDNALIALVEIKCSDWNAMNEDAVRRNVKRYTRQIWTYIESQIAIGKEVCPGVIFPKRPESKERIDFIEALFGEYGIAVVWEDETMKERKERAGNI